MDVSDIGRWLLVAAVVLGITGGLLLLAGGLGVGRLPGDLSFGGDRFRVYVPLASCVIISIIATVVLNLFLRR